MIWAQFKDPVSHMCLAGAAEASRSLGKEGAGSSPFNDKFFVTEFSLFQPLPWHLGQFDSFTHCETAN